MDKLLVFPGKTDKGVFNFLIDYDRDHLVKTASEYHPTISAYINSAKRIQGKTQLLLTALGAGEYWGFNSNGDWFGEDQLAHDGPDYGFRTFEHYAKYYKHHVNKDPGKSYGDVLLSVYNPVYHRVELIVAIDHNKAPDIIEKIENGETVYHSMGCKIPYDICSICGNKAPSRKSYCEHLRFMLGQMDSSTGRAVYAINIKPKFFDISYVIIPADKTAMGLKKVAYSTGVLFDTSGKIISSAEAAEKEAAQKKIADIVKEVPSEPPSSTDLVDNEVAKHIVRTVAETQIREPKLPNEVIDRLCSVASLPRILSTMSACAMLPKPQEFQRIFLISRGERGLADKLDRLNVCFDPSYSNYDDSDLINAGMAEKPSEELADILSPYFEQRSYTAPLLVKRMIVMVKKAGEIPQQPHYISAEDKPDHSIMKTLAAGAAIYAALSMINGKGPSKILEFIKENPRLAAMLAAGITIPALSVAKSQSMDSYKGRFSGTEAIVPETTNLYDRIERMRERPYVKISAAEGATGAVLRRLLIGVPAVHMVSAGLQRHHEMNPQEQEGTVRKFIRKHPNLLGGVVAADALLAAHGKGSYRITKHLSDAQSRWLKGEPLLKAAGVIDDTSFSSEVKSAFISGYGDIQDGVFGSLFDQKILELGSQLIG